MLSKILSRFFSGPGDAERLKKVVIPSFLIHALSGVLGLLTILVLTRNLGSTRYGIYAYAFAVTGLLVTLSVNGFSFIAIRETSALLAKGQIELWKGFYRWSLKSIMFISLTVAFLAALFVALFTYKFNLLSETDYTLPVICSFAAIPPFCLVNYYSALLLGKHNTLLGLAGSNVIRPFVFLVSVLAAILLFKNLTATRAILISGASIVIGFLFAVTAFYSKTGFKGVQPKYDKSRWKSMFWHFFLLSGINSINANIDILLLGFFTQASAVGIFSTAEKISVALYIFMAIMNRISAATLSRLHTKGETQQLQTTVTKITRWATFISLPAFIAVALFSKPVLSYFGRGFDAGQTALLILCAGQLISMVMGPVGNLSIMTGNEKTNIIYTFAMIVLDIILNVILIPLYGIIGAALTSSLTIIIWNFAMFVSIKKMTGISSWIFG